jgi:hypothetical protein
MAVVEHENLHHELSVGWLALRDKVTYLLADKLIFEAPFQAKKEFSCGTGLILWQNWEAGQCGLG